MRSRTKLKQAPPDARGQAPSVRNPLVRQVAQVEEPQLEPQAAEDLERFVNKTYKVRQATIERVKVTAEAHNLGIGELVDWALNLVVDGIQDGTVQIPIEHIQIEFPVVGKRRVGRPSPRKLARGKLVQST